MGQTLPHPTQDDLYDRDFYAWTLAQAEALRAAGRAGNNAPVDWENVAEEIESMGRSDKQQIEARLEVLLAHLLKLLFCPALLERNARQWGLAVREQRNRLNKLLRASPSLRPHADEVYPECYREAVHRAAVESDGDERDFPAEPPFTLDDALSNDFPVQGKPAPGGGSPAA